MLEQLLNHIRAHGLCKPTDKILLAVSGGVDSMVMLHLLKEADFSIGVAHCNYQLRGRQSDADEEWVRDVCAAANIPFMVRRFDTHAISEERKISIQMTARDLRYEFFAEVLESQGYDLVATAHHFNDLVESIVLNLVRGTGMDGFRGIAPKKENIIRPMLFATREQIAAYALEKNIEWREDASNHHDDYQRNFVRHQVIPRFREMNPSFEESFRLTHERLLGARSFARAFIDEFRSSALVHGDRDTMTLDIRRIRAAEYPAVLLWELIKDLGFRYDQCKKIVGDHPPGKFFDSETHQLLVDRSHYIIDRKRPRTFLSQAIERGQRIAGAESFAIVMKEVEKANFSMVRDSAVAQLDCDKLNFPLLWRKWQAGDYFVPLGMSAGKKVSDFLIDLKIPFNSKADVSILQSGNDIVWIVGHRIHDRYKVTDDTRNILVIEVVETSGDNK